MLHKHLIFPLIVVALLFVSCTKDPEVPQSNNDGTSQYSEHEWYWDDSTKNNISILQ